MLRLQQKRLFHSLCSHPPLMAALFHKVPIFSLLLVCCTGFFAAILCCHSLQPTLRNLPNVMEKMCIVILSIFLQQERRARAFCNLKRLFNVNSLWSALQFSARRQRDMTPWTIIDDCICCKSRIACTVDNNSEICGDIHKSRIFVKSTS